MAFEGTGVKHETMNRLLIVDVEATCWSSEEHGRDEMEIIEIGAMLVDASNLKELGEFNSFVRPVRNPLLSDFCKKLTSIQQQDVDSADGFLVVYKRFLAWTGNPAEVTLASWGAYDAKQLKQDCAYHALVYPFCNDHFNIKKHFAARQKCKPCGMSKALRILGLELKGIHHRAIHDVRNILRILQAVSTLGKSS